MFKRPDPKPVDQCSLEELVTPRLSEFVARLDGKGENRLYDLVIESIERPLIRLVLGQTNGNQIKAAALLGINRNTLRKKIHNLKIDMEEVRNNKMDRSATKGQGH